MLVFTRSYDLPNPPNPSFWSFIVKQIGDMQSFQGFKRLVCKPVSVSVATSIFYIQSVRFMRGVPTAASVVCVSFTCLCTDASGYDIREESVCPNSNPGMKGGACLSLNFITYLFQTWPVSESEDERWGTTIPVRPCCVRAQSVHVRGDAGGNRKSGIRLLGRRIHCCKPTSHCK